MAPPPAARNDRLRALKEGSKGFRDLPVAEVCHQPGAQFYLWAPLHVYKLTGYRPCSVPLYIRCKSQTKLAALRISTPILTGLAPVLWG